MKFLNEMHSFNGGNSLENYDRAIDMINSAVEHHDSNDNFDAIADIDSLVQFIQGRHHDFTPALEQTVRDIIADEMGHGEAPEEQEEFRGGGKSNRRGQGPEFRGGGVKREPYSYSGRSKRYEKYQTALKKAAKGEEEESFADRVSRYKEETKTLKNKLSKDRQRRKYGIHGKSRRGSGRPIRQEEQEVDNWSVDWDEEVEKSRNEPRKRVGNRRSPPNGTSVWNAVMDKAEQEEVDDTLNQRRSKRLDRDVSRTGTMRRRDPDDAFIPDIRHGRSDYRHTDTDRSRRHAALMARKARPHIEQEEDKVNWNKEVKDFQKRRKTYEPKFARRKNRLVGRRRSTGPVGSAFSVSFGESFKQFNEMYRDSQHGLTIDLSGPDGNAFFLLGYAKKLARQLDKDPETILNDMKYSDYDHLLDVFEREFGSVISFINRPGEKWAQMKDSEQSDVREPTQDGNRITTPSRRD